MTSLVTIDDKMLGFEEKPANNLRERFAVRVALFDEHNKIAFLHYTEYKFHTFPGGGIQDEETEEMALKREALEETGFNITEINKIVTIEELRTINPLRQFSHCYKAKRLGKEFPLDLKDYEKNAGIVVKWLNKNEILEILGDELPTQSYAGKFMNMRDQIFLKSLG